MLSANLINQCFGTDRGQHTVNAYRENPNNNVYYVKCCVAVPAGPCARCEMVCMDQSTGVRAGPEPLLTLASYRRQRGRVFLGILLGQSSC